MESSIYASDTEREAVCIQLGQAMAEGRITLDEHEGLIGAAVAARRRGELTKLLAGLPNASLPNPRVPAETRSVSRRTLRFVPLFCTMSLAAAFMLLVAINLGLSPEPAVSPAVVSTPTPGPSITDPQDRAFVQAMIDFINSGVWADPDHPSDIDQNAVLDIAHRLRDPKTDVRQTYLLVMDSSAYKSLTEQQKYKAGKLALSIWRPDGVAAWVELGKNDRYE